MRGLFDYHQPDNNNHTECIVGSIYTWNGLVVTAQGIFMFEDLGLVDTHVKYSSQR